MNLEICLRKGLPRRSQQASFRIIITRYSEPCQPIKVRYKQYSLAWDIQVSVMNKLEDFFRGANARRTWEGK